MTVPALVVVFPVEGRPHYTVTATPFDQVDQTVDRVFSCLDSHIAEALHELCDELDAIQETTA